MTPTRRLAGKRGRERRRRQRSEEPSRDPLVGRERTARRDQKRTHHGDLVEDRASHTPLCWLLRMEVVRLPLRRPPLRRPPLHQLPQTTVVRHRLPARHPWRLLPHRSSHHRWLQAGRPRASEFTEWCSGRHANYKPGCKLRDTTDKDDLWLSALTDDPELRRIWDERLPINHERNRPKSPRVCFWHFKKDDYMRCQQRLAGLRQGALPLIETGRT